MACLFPLPPFLKNAIRSGAILTLPLPLLVAGEVGGHGECSVFRTGHARRVRAGGRPRTPVMKQPSAPLGTRCERFTNDLTDTLDAEQNVGIPKPQNSVALRLQIPGTH